MRLLRSSRINWVLCGFLIISTAARLRAQENGGPALGVRTLGRHADAVKAVAVSPDGRFVLSASRDATLAMWEAGSGKRLRLFNGHRAGVACAAFSPDGKKVLSGSQDRLVILWDALTGKRLKTFEGHGGWVSWVAFGPDGRRAFSGALDRTVSVWDLEAGKRIRFFEAHPQRLISVAFSRDGRHALVGDRTKTLWIWDLKAGTKVGKLTASIAWSYAVALSPDGKMALASHANHTIDLIQVETGAILRALEGQDGWAWSVRFSPDGTLAAAGGQGGDVALWDVRTGRLLGRFTSPGGTAWSVAFSPGQRFIVAGYEDGRIRIWHPAVELAATAAKWLPAWKEKNAPARKKAFAPLVSQLSDQKWEVRALAMEKLIAVGDQSAAAILDGQFPGRNLAAPTPKQLEDLLAELDADDFERRSRAQARFKAYGDRVLPWIEKTLGGSKGLSTEVKISLGAIRSYLREGGAWTVTTARTRMLLALLEMPRTKEVAAALETYAKGPKGNALADMARRSLGK